MGKETTFQGADEQNAFPQSLLTEWGRKGDTNRVQAGKFICLTTLYHKNY
jgi:hypothetical protein